MMAALINKIREAGAAAPGLAQPGSAAGGGVGPAMQAAPGAALGGAVRPQPPQISGGDPRLGGSLIEPPGYAPAPVQGPMGAGGGLGAAAGQDAAFWQAPAEPGPMGDGVQNQDLLRRLLIAIAAQQGGMPRSQPFDGQPQGPSMGMPPFLQ